MLVHLLALGIAFHVPAARSPAARSHAVVSRGARVTMLEDSKEATRDDQATVVGMSTPTNQAPMPDGTTLKDYLEYRLKFTETSLNKIDKKLDDLTRDKSAAALPRAAVAEPTFTARVARVVGPLALVAGSVAGTVALSPIVNPPPASVPDITMAEIMEAQKEWGNAIVQISKTYLDGGDVVEAAGKAADQLYGYGSNMDVLFKPTKAAEDPFRPTAEGALSYFIGGDKVDGGFKEDKGFALGPGGVGWKHVTFDNNKVDFNGATAQAMGEYYFYPIDGAPASKVEYTFGYKRNADGKLRIYLHHSSLPYPGKKKASTPVTMGEIVEAQKEWGNAIVKISKTYLDGGDYVAEAAKAAEDLYGYGSKMDVLFKPTKAAEDPFRPTAEGALSYFIGGDKVDGGFKEDKGFALGPGGVGWKHVTFDNNKVDFNGATAQAMGEYYFYPIDGAPASKVEYTFGYKRNADGKLRIYLHHSSLPYVPH